MRTAVGRRPPRSPEQRTPSTGRRPIDANGPPTAIPPNSASPARRQGGSGDPPVRRHGAGATRVGSSVIDRRPSGSRGSCAVRHRTHIHRATPAGGADQGVRPYGVIDEAHPLGWRRRDGLGSSPGARWLRPSASSVTRESEATQGCGRHGGSRGRALAPAEPTNNNCGRGDCHSCDARPRTTPYAIAVTPGALRLRVSASAVTRGWRPRKGAADTVALEGEPSHPRSRPTTLAGAAIAASRDARPPTTRPAIAVTATRPQPSRRPRHPRRTAPAPTR